MKILIFFLTLVLTGCNFAALPKAGLNGTGAAVGTVIGTMVGQPVLGASIGGSATTFASESLFETDVPVTDFWSLLGELVDVAGWLLGLFILVPMVLTYLIPAPLQRRKKNETDYSRQIE